MIRHPYQFVPFARNAPSVQALKPQSMIGHERIHPGLHSGTFHCMLEALTPLSIKQHFGDLRQRRSRVWLPGSSIKGMVRNLAEMIGAGCTLYFKYKAQRGRRQIEPHTPIKPCDSTAACLTCRIFGYAPPGEEGGWQGKARFYDSAALPSIQWMESPAGGNARLQFQDARHTAFYGTTQNPKGWKIYWHSRRPTPAHPDFTAACVPPGTKFSFRVDFENLDQEELAVLQFCLSLEHQCSDHPAVRLCHKLGYGKGLGLGSCRITTTMEVSNPRRYLSQPAPAAPPRSTDCLLKSYLQEPGFAMLKECLSWDGAPDRLEFPDQAWFRDHSQDSIQTFEEDKNRQAAPAAGPRVTLADIAFAKPKAKGLPLDKRVRVRLTAIKGNQATAETVEAFGGAKYTTTFEKPYGANVGETFSVKADSVDEKKHTFKSRQPKAE